MAERVEAVFVNAGSYVMRPKSSSSTFIWRKSIARTVPSLISTCEVLPVRLSVTDSVSLAVATAPSCPSAPWVSLMFLSLRSGDGPPAGQRLRATRRLADGPRARLGARAGRAVGPRAGRAAAPRCVAGRRPWRAAVDGSADRGGRARGAVEGPADHAASAPGFPGGDEGTLRRGARAGRPDRRAVGGGARTGRAGERRRRPVRRGCVRVSPGRRAGVPRPVRRHRAPAQEPRGAAGRDAPGA